jgi:hypothetical protein
MRLVTVLLHSVVHLNPAWQPPEVVVAGSVHDFSQ